MNVTTWLENARHPSPGALFALPSAVYFLLKFRPDLATFACKSLADRIALYMWWEGVARHEYPDFDWQLRAEDSAYLASVDDTTLISSHPKSLAYWLKSARPSIFDQRNLTARLLLPLETGDDSQVQLPAFLSVIVASRPDLLRAFDLTTLAGRMGCMTWWQDHGQKEYPRIEWSPSVLLNALLRPEQDGSPEFIPLPAFLKVIWRERGDLQQSFDITNAADRLGLLAWWNRDGYQAYPRIHWRYTVPNTLLSSDEPVSEAGLPLPRLLIVVWHARPDLRRAFDLGSIASCLAYLDWWNSTGSATYHIRTWSHDQLLPSFAALGRARWAAASGLPRVLEAAWSSLPALRAAFDVRTAEGIDGLVSWWKDYGRVEYPTLGAISVTSSTDIGATCRYVTNIERTWCRRPPGVNIVGFPQGVLGLGEDARMAARALATVNIECALVNAPMASPPKIEHSMDHLLSEDLRYGISIFCLPPPEMLRLSMEGGRRLIECDTYRIGAWPWELPHWPTSFGKIHRMVDEIWAQSRFVQSVYARLGDTPVHHMPMAVEIPTPIDPSRERFGLPKGTFLFYLMFDGNSWLTRKNPIAGVRAFKKAFDASTGGVGLVIKAMNVRDDDPSWRQLCDIAASDDRIHIVAERLDRQDSIDFMASCDAYVSLHRSEGFGRVIAEAMLLGQPVVVTNFSGNVDFCDKETALLVDGEIVPLRAGEYLFAEGQYWCDPDVTFAAEQLRRLADDRALGMRIAQAGQARIIRDYSIDAVARAYDQRLDAIQKTVSGS